MSSSFSSAKREYLPLQQHTSSPSRRRAIESSRSEPSGGQNSTSPSLHWTVAYPAPPSLHRLLASRLQLYSILVFSPEHIQRLHRRLICISIILSLLASRFSLNCLSQAIAPYLLFLADQAASSPPVRQGLSLGKHSTSCAPPLILA